MSERRPRLSASIEARIPFHDCDPLFVAWHGRYFEYMALARAELMRAVDLDVPQVAAMGYRMYVTDARCRYMFPMRYGDTVRVTATLLAVSPLIKVGYDLHNVTHDRRTARASTTLAVLDEQGRLVAEPPPALRARLEGAA